MNKEPLYQIIVKEDFDSPTGLTIVKPYTMANEVVMSMLHAAATDGMWAIGERSLRWMFVENLTKIANVYNVV